MNNDTISRQWELLRLIPRHPCKTTAESLFQALISSKHKTTKRTVERDLTLLSSIFPITADERDKPYGWCWAKGVVNIDIPGMTDIEAFTFKMLELHLGRLLPGSYRDKLGPYFVMAERKLEQTHKGSSSRQWSDKIRVVQDFSGALIPSINYDIQNTVLEALLDERQIHIKYRRFGSMELEEHIVSPCAVVTYKGVQFLLASRQDSQTVDLFRLHRIESAETLPERSVCPKNFDVDRYLFTNTFQERAKKGVRFRGVFTHYATERARDWPVGTDQRIFEDTNTGRWVVEATVPPDAKRFLEDLARKDGGNGVLNASHMMTYYVQFTGSGGEPNSLLDPRNSMDEAENETSDLEKYYLEIFPEDAAFLKMHFCFKGPQ